jgi:hypothetical protein
LILIIEILEFGSAPIFGTNQAAPAAQPANVFSSNVTGTPVKFNPVFTQGKFCFFIFKNIEIIDHYYLYYQRSYILKLIKF